MRDVEREIEKRDRKGGFMAGGRHPFLFLTRSLKKLMFWEFGVSENS